MVARLLAVASLIAASLAQTSSAGSDGSTVTCSQTTTPNAAVNPSWEDGTTGWSYSFSASTTNAYADNGGYSL